MPCRRHRRNEPDCSRCWSGGKAEGRSPSDFDRDELDLGTEVELEHTSNRSLAQQIAMDHLVEDPDYYTKLARVHHENPERVIVKPDGRTTCCNAFTSISLDDEVEYCKACYRAVEGYEGDAVYAMPERIDLPKASKGTSGWERCPRCEKAADGEAWHPAGEPCRICPPEKDEPRRSPKRAAKPTKRRPKDGQVSRGYYFCGSCSKDSSTEVWHPVGQDCPNR